MKDKNSNLIDLIVVQENKVNEVDVCGGMLLLRLFCQKNEVVFCNINADECVFVLGDRLCSTARRG